MEYSEICETCGSSFTVEMNFQKDELGIHCPSCGDFIEVFEGYFSEEDLD